MRWISALLLSAALSAQSYSGLWWRFCEDQSHSPWGCAAYDAPGFKNPTTYSPSPEVWTQTTARISWYGFDVGQPVALLLTDQPPNSWNPWIPQILVDPNHVVLFGTVDQLNTATFVWPLPTSVPWLPAGRTRVGCGQVVELSAPYPPLAAACGSYLFYIDAQN